MRLHNLGWTAFAGVSLLIAGCGGDVAAPDGASDAAASFGDSDEAGREGAAGILGGETPEDALQGFIDAMNARSFRRANLALGAAYVFHTSGGDELPPVFSRAEVARALWHILSGRDVVSVSLQMEFQAAEPAGDLAHPDWMEIDVTSADLRVVARDTTGNLTEYAVRGHPARFVFGRGPSAFRDGAGWQIVSQWDLYEDESDGGGELVEDVTWSRLLSLFM